MRASSGLWDPLGRPTVVDSLFSRFVAAFEEHFSFRHEENNTQTFLQLEESFGLDPQLL